MTYIKLDDKFPRHPKVVGLSDAAFRLYVNGLCYCGEHLTDGRIPEASLPTLLTNKKVAAHADVLVAEGLWQKDGDAYLIRDYLGHQKSKAEVEALREKGRRGGLARVANLAEQRKDVEDEGASNGRVDHGELLAKVKATADA